MNHPIDELFKNRFQETENPKLQEDFESFLRLYDAEKRRKPLAWMWFAFGGLMLSAVIAGWILRPFGEFKQIIDNELVQSNGIIIKHSNPKSILPIQAENILPENANAVKAGNESSSANQSNISNKSTASNHISGENVNARSGIESNSISRDKTNISNRNINQQKTSSQANPGLKNASSSTKAKSTLSRLGNAKSNPITAITNPVNPNTENSFAVVTANNKDIETFPNNKTGEIVSNEPIQQQSTSAALSTLPIQPELSSISLENKSATQDIEVLDQSLPFKAFHPVRKLIAISIGTGIWAGQSTSKGNAKSWAQDIRIPVQLRLGNALFAQIAPGFKHLQGNFSYSASRIQKTYDLGLQKNELKNTPSDLYQWTLPISIGAYAQKWNFQGGVQAELLQGVYGELSKEAQNTTLNLREGRTPEMQTNVSTTGWLSRQDLRQFNFLAFTEIGYQVIPQMQIQLGAYYQPNSLSTFSDEKHFANNQDHWWFRFGLSYNLIP